MMKFSRKLSAMRSLPPFGASSACHLKSWRECRMTSVAAFGHSDVTRRWMYSSSGITFCKPAVMYASTQHQDTQGSVWQSSFTVALYFEEHKGRLFCHTLHGASVLH